MPTQKVEFQFITGLKRAIFRNRRLRGSWNGNGRYSDDWTESPMQEAVGEDGCPIFKASISLDLADQDKTFRWGVVVDGPQGNNLWGIPTEVQDMNSVERYRQFRLTGGGTPQVERYYFHLRASLGGQQTLRGRKRPSPACVLPSGPPMREASRWSSASRRTATLPMTALELILRSRSSLFPALPTAFGKADRREILKSSKAFHTCIAS